MLKIGIVGCGAIGTSLAKAIEERFSADALIIGLCDTDDARAQKLSDSLKSKPKVLILGKLIADSDLVAEAASSAASAAVLESSILRGKDCMIMSVGGIIDRQDLLELANRKKINVYIPSGAIAGIDAVKAAALGRISKVTLVTRKPPKALEGAAYIKEKNIDLNSIKSETVIFEGIATEAVKYFAQNINVAAVLSLAGIGADKTIVRIASSPEFITNSHEVIIESDSGTICARTDNVPSPHNPKTSYLAILSAIAMLEQIFKSVKIGT